MLVVCGLQHVAASAAALFEASSSTAFCLASASAAECIRYGSKKITYNCNYKCKQTAMLVLCELQPAAASATALFEASSSATFCFCSSAFRFTSAIDFIIYCGKKSQVSILDKNSKKKDTNCNCKCNPTAKNVGKTTGLQPAATFALLSLFFLPLFVLQPLLLNFFHPLVFQPLFLSLSLLPLFIFSILLGFLGFGLSLRGFLFFSLSSLLLCVILLSLSLVSASSPPCRSSLHKF
jgi:hypothetical protein